MILHQIFRTIHTGPLLQDASRKSLLAKLRRKTGYAFVNCKKALELHSNDIEKAEEWLKQQAQELGWAQAEKLQARNTSQGLVALSIKKKHGVIAEINCETDFVARNAKFHGLAETVVNALMDHGMALKSDQELHKYMVTPEALKQLVAADGKNLMDHTALTIGSVGENIQLKRGFYIAVPDDVQLFGATHPAPINSVPTSFGKYGAFVALRSKNNCKEYGPQLCQHIIGMNPSKIGNITEDTPNANVEEETTLIYQEFLLDPLTSVQHLLLREEIEIVDFVRFEVGETQRTGETLDTAASCN